MLDKGGNKMKFTKMQGCGNDYVYINGFEESIPNPNDLAQKISNRNFGVGSDGLVLILPSQKADFTMRMFNSDGSESEMCGNAIRCVGKYVYDRKMTNQSNISIETLAGLKILDLFIENGKVQNVRVDMGEPILIAEQIPVLSHRNPVIGEVIIVEDTGYEFTCVSMGNPHAITYIKGVDSFDVARVGRQIEKDQRFPKKTNVEFVEVIDDTTLKMRVWERGAGETMACGTGACAVLVASVLNHKCSRKATVRLLGGDLMIEWSQEDNHVYMTGPAVMVFEGIWLNNQ